MAGVRPAARYGSIDNLLASLGPSVRVVCLQETKLSSRADLDRQLACPEVGTGQGAEGALCAMCTSAGGVLGLGLGSWRLGLRV